jgi:hypothetical protein
VSEPCTGRRRRWLFPGSALMLVLLALPWLVPKSRLVTRMRGEEPAGDELKQVKGLGYYEALIDGPGGGEPDEDDFPPGFVAIADSGIVGLDPGYRRWRLLPNLDLRWNGTTFRTGRLGNRGPDVSPEKPAGTFRAVVLGSSITMGHGIDDEDGYVRLFERWLAGELAPERRVEAVNLAAPGEAPSQRLLRLGGEVEPLGPDWILCDATPIDVLFEEQHLHSIVSRGVPIPFGYVRDVIDRAGVTAGTTADEFSRKLRPFHKDLLAGAFAGWAEHARRLGVPLTVVLLPRTDVKGKSPVLNELIRETAGRHGLGLVDLTAAFDDLEPDELVVGPWDRHPGVAGHRALFEDLREAASRPGGIPTRTRPCGPRRRGSLVRGDRPHADPIGTRRRSGVDLSIRRGLTRRLSRRQRGSGARDRFQPRLDRPRRPTGPTRGR